MSTKPYLKGPSGVLKSDSKWLGVADLPWDKDTKVTIEHAITIDGEKMSGEDPVSGGGLKLRGAKKQWKFGAECLATLNKLFTNEVSNWIGKEIYLYVDTGVWAFGKNTGGVRIRDKKADAHRAKAATLAGAAPEPEPDIETEPDPATDFAPDTCGGEWGATDDHPAEPCELGAGHTGACGPKE